MWFFCILSLKNPVPCSVLFWADGVSTTFQNASARGEKKESNTSEDNIVEQRLMVDVSEISLYTISIFWDSNCCIIALSLFQQGVVKVPVTHVDHVTV